jgi:hypothetical protein
MEIIIIALLFFFAMSIITFGLAWLITKKERQTFKLEQNQNLLVQFQKAAKGFKIAAITSVSLPLLLLFPFLFDKPTHSSADDLLVFFIFLSIEILISSLCCIPSYNYLFCSASNTKAFYILFIPFIPIFFIGTFLTLVGGGFLGIFLIIPYVIILAVMAYILYFKRKQFNAKQNT